MQGRYEGRCEGGTRDGRGGTRGGAASAPARPPFLRRGVAAASCSSPRRVGRASPPWPRWRPFQTRRPAAAGGNDWGSLPPLAGTGPGVRQGGQQRRAGPGAVRATPQRPASEGFALVSHLSWLFRRKRACSFPSPFSLPVPGPCEGVSGAAAAGGHPGRAGVEQLEGTGRWLIPPGSAKELMCFPGGFGVV